MAPEVLWPSVVPKFLTKTSGEAPFSHYGPELWIRPAETVFINGGWRLTLLVRPLTHFLSLFEKYYVLIYFFLYFDLLFIYLFIVLFSSTASTLGGPCGWSLSWFLSSLPCGCGGRGWGFNKVLFLFVFCFFFTCCINFIYFFSTKHFGMRFGHMGSAV